MGKNNPLEKSDSLELLGRGRRRDPEAWSARIAKRAFALTQKPPKPEKPSRSWH